MAAGKTNTLRELFVRIGVVGDKDSKKKLGRFRRIIKSLVGDIKIFKANLAALAISGLFSRMISGVTRLSRAFKNLLVDSSKFAATQEEAEIRLRSAMEIAGDFSDLEFQGLKNFATELQKVSTIGDEVTIAALATAKAFGATNENAKELVTAASNLSSAMGLQFDQILRQLAKSLGGYAGELGEILPVVKTLNAEELKAGKLFAIVNKEFGGLAQKNLKAYNKQVEQLSNIWGDLKETIGDPINDALLPFVTRFKNDLEDLQPVLRLFGRDIGQIIKVAFRFFETIGGQELVGKTLKKFSSFLLTMALLTEDFFLFMNGEKSFLGKRLDMKGGLTGIFRNMFKDLSKMTANFFVSVGRDIAKNISQGVRDWWNGPIDTSVPLSRVDIAAFRNEPFTLPAQPEPRLPSFSDRTNLNSKGDQFNIDIKADIKTNQAAESIKKTINAAVQSYQGKKEIN